MKKMFVLFALCAMATSLVTAKTFDQKYKDGELTLPVVYTGTLKLNGWGDEGLCYNWQSNRNSYPLFLGLCQPCLDCVPCNIDMRHLPPTIQKGDYQNKPPVADAKPNIDGNIDPTEAFFNRARLYLVSGTETKEEVELDANGRQKTVKNKYVTIKVVDLIDAYWGKDGFSYTPVLFQFYNTVNSKDRKDAPGNAAYGRIASFYQFPIYNRNFYEDDAVKTSKNTYGMNNVTLNAYEYNHTNSSTAKGSRNNTGLEDPCTADRQEDGIGLAALIGSKDYKSFFKIENSNGKKESYKLVSIKSLSGDFFAVQREYTNGYVCRKGEGYVLYDDYDGTVPAENDTEYDGKGAWYATGSITLRRNDSVTKKMMAAVLDKNDKTTCIPCNSGSKAKECRSYLDQGMVDYLIQRQYNGYKMIYIVDLDNDGIYGEIAACGGRMEKFTVTQQDVKNSKNSYLSNLVNTKTLNDASVNTKDDETKEPKLYNLPPESATL